MNVFLRIAVVALFMGAVMTGWLSAAFAFSHLSTKGEFMKQIPEGKAVIVAAKYNQNLYPPPDFPPSTKANPAYVEPGGAAVVGARVLQRLGLQVVLMGRRTPALTPFLDLAALEGIVCKMLAEDGPEATNVVLPGWRILRVTRGPRCIPTKEESGLLSDLRPRAIAVGGSMDKEYAAFLAEFAAATGVWFCFNPNPSADLAVVDVGGKAMLQVSFTEFADGDASPVALARQLLAQTAAAVVCVTDGDKGAYAVERKSSHVVLHAPAIPIIEPAREIGAGDAHFGAFVATFLEAPPAIRLERSLTVGRLAAARHIAGLGPGSWTDLALFQAQLDRIPNIAEAA
jgi:sugar/nucleoside kinase (ribokinase family)